jgi:tRNA uridine 5-carboxymethylaminomethyl modification enzyme
MFTSRAEFRLLLRIDNADERLTPLAHAVGLVDEARWSLFSEKMARLTEAKERLQAEKIRAVRRSTAEDGGESEPIAESRTAWEWLKREDVDSKLILKEVGLHDWDEELLARVLTDIRYQGYLLKQESDAERLQRVEAVRIPPSMVWQQIPGLSIELQQKLSRVRPVNLGQASRISGMTPAAITLLMIYLQGKPDATAQSEQKDCLV